jgi:hypothetical protein
LHISFKASSDKCSPPSPSFTTSAVSYTAVSTTDSHCQYPLMQCADIRAPNVLLVSATTGADIQSALLSDPSSTYLPSSYIDGCIVLDVHRIGSSRPPVVSQPLLCPPDHIFQHVQLLDLGEGATELNGYASGLRTAQRSHRRIPKAAAPTADLSPPRSSSLAYPCLPLRTSGPSAVW